MHKFCNKRTAVGIVSVIDMIFGAVLFSLYLRKLTFFYVTDMTPSQYSPPTLRLFLLLPLSLNGFQVLIAYHLLMSTRKKNPFRSLAKATMWFQATLMIMAFLCFKLFLMLVFFNNQNSESWPITLTVWETIFKLIGIFIVHDFVEDLKSQVYSAPTVHFYSVYVPPSSPSPNSPSQTICEAVPIVSFSPPSGIGESSRPSSPPSYQNALNYPNYMNNNNNRLSTASSTSNPVFV